MTQVGFAYTGPIHRTTAPALREAIDAYDRVDRHWGRSDFSVQAISPIVGPAMLLGRYRRQPELFWEKTPSGYSVWMLAGMHRVWSVVMTEVRAGRAITTRHVAELARVSQGYASKVIRRLAWFGFIVIDSVKMGRFGRIVASVAKVFHPYATRESWKDITLRSTGGILSDAKRAERLAKPWTLDELDL